MGDYTLHVELRRSTRTQAYLADPVCALVAGLRFLNGEPTIQRVRLHRYR